MRFSLASVAALPLAVQAAVDLSDLFNDKAGSVVDNEANGLLSAVQDKVNNLVNPVKGKTSSLVGTVQGKAGSLVGNVKDKASQVVGDVKDKVGAMASPAVQQALDLSDIFDDNSFVEQPGLLRFPVNTARGGTSKHQRRQVQTGLTSQQTGYFYTIQLTMGTPGRTVNVNFDTGSSELWVNPTCANSFDPTFCKSFGQFGESSSFKDLGHNNTLRYAVGNASIEYGYDFVTVGSAKINQQVFGVAYDSTDHSVGIIGVAPALSGWDSPYAYVIDNLLAQKFIQSRAFALDLRNIGSDRGAVIFGGIDTKKFSGALEPRPIIPAGQAPDGRTRYWIFLDGISVTMDDGTTAPVFDQANGQAVLLDSGYTVSALPTAHFQKILAAFPSAKADPNNGGQYLVDCGVAKSVKGSVNYKFGSTVIKVPYADFIWQQPQNNLCVLGVIEDNTFPVLGDTFLRAAYAVFDWDNRMIHLANNEDCGSNLVPITSGPGAVPNLVGECGKPQSDASNTTSAASPSGTAGAGHNADASNSTVSSNGTVSSASSTPTSSPTYLTPTGFRNSTAGVATETAAPTVTETVKATKVWTVSSCKPTVTNCPVGKVTTSVITMYTTYCPLSGKPVPTYTRESCSQITTTINLPKTVYTSGSVITTAVPATVKPVTPASSATQIPGCTNCAKPVSTAAPTAPATTSVAPAQTNAPVTPVPVTPAPAITTMQTQVPVAQCTTCLVPSQPPLTAGAKQMMVPGIAALVAAAIVAM